MKKQLLILFVVISLPFSGWANTVPSSIVSLKPNITEILFALGAGDKIKGVTTWCDKPAVVKDLPKVADYVNINAEKILTINPDLVIASSENGVKKQFLPLENAGIKILFTSFGTISELYDSIQKIALVLGKEKEGAALCDRIKNELTTVAKENKTPGKTALLLVGKRPMISASHKTFIGEIAKVAGFTNVIDSSTPYPMINSEIVLARKPDVIFDFTMGGEEFSSIQSNLNSKIVKLDIAELRAGPDLPVGARKMLEAFNAQE